MTHHKTHALKPFWSHSHHKAKQFDHAIPIIVTGLCITLTVIYVWSFHLYQSVLLP
jgi:hypothetical protein